jgi:hypothetical protein
MLETVPSTYVVQFTDGEFGGMLWSEQHVFSDADGIRQALVELAAAPWSRRQNAFSYEMTLGVWVIQAGQVDEFIDLADCFSSTCEGQVLTLPQLKDSPTIDTRELIEDGVELELRLDWAAVERLLPPLTEPLMQASHHLRFVGEVEDEWLALTRGAPYGSTSDDYPATDEEKDRLVKRALAQAKALLPSR